MYVPDLLLPLSSAAYTFQEATRIAGLVESTLGAEPLPKDTDVFELSRILPKVSSELNFVNFSL